jgi:hypothetical protein
MLKRAFPYQKDRARETLFKPPGQFVSYAETSTWTLRKWPPDWRWRGQQMAVVGAPRRFQQRVRRAVGGPLISVFWGFLAICCQNTTTGLGRTRKKNSRELYFQFV